MSLKSFCYLRSKTISSEDKKKKSNPDNEQKAIKIRREQISRAQEVLDSNSKVETIAISKDKQRFARREGHSKARTNI